MAFHAAHKLNALFVRKTNMPKKYSDGLGLYLVEEPKEANAGSNA